jgi:5-enolpyruvylshikimate-3-phosphate synthase
LDASVQARKIIQTAMAELMELGASHDSAATLLAIQGTTSIQNPAYLETVLDHVKALYFEAAAEQRAAVSNDA